MEYKAVLTRQQMEGRAKNAVLGFLQKELVVPKVFFDAQWPSKNQSVDVLAVDRAGAGDVHIFEIKSIGNATAAIPTLFQTPAHFKYLVILDEQTYRLRPEALISPNGVGKIGVISVSEESDGSLRTILRQKAERFADPDKIYSRIDRFVASNRPVWQVRP